MGSEDIKLFKEKKLEQMRERIQKLRMEEIEELRKRDPLHFVGKDEDREERE